MSWNANVGMARSLVWIERREIRWRRGTQPDQVLGERVEIAERELAVEPRHLALVAAHVERRLGVGEEAPVVRAGAEVAEARRRRARHAVLARVAVAARGLEHLEA